MYDDFWTFLAIFGHFRTIKHLKHLKYTNCNYLGAKRKGKHMEMASYSKLEIWSPLRPKTHLGSKNGLKMAEGSQNWT